MLIDLSHTVEHGMITYKGLPARLSPPTSAEKRPKLSTKPGTEFHIGKIEMVANTGTYLDSPFHRYSDGKDLAELEATSLANLDGQVVRTLNAGSDASGCVKLTEARPGRFGTEGQGYLVSYRLGHSLAN